MFGVALLGVALLMLERLLPPAVALLLWGVLLICSAVYMGALTALPPNASGWRTLWQGLGVVLLIYGALMLVGAAAGGRDTLQPLRGLWPTGGSVANAEQALFKPIKSVADLERELAQARANGQPVLLDFTPIGAYPAKSWNATPLAIRRYRLRCSGLCVCGPMSPPMMPRIAP